MAEQVSFRWSRISRPFIRPYTRVRRAKFLGTAAGQRHPELHYREGSVLDLLAFKTHELRVEPTPSGSPPNKVQT
jgi:hypothetical protein